MTAAGEPTAALGLFSPLVRAWFAERFGAPTAIQRAAWPEIATGRDVLLAAPTGSGKTLAAFLWSLDRLLALAARGALEDRTRIVYVSPLKALSNDVRRNLQDPLAELERRAWRAGCMIPGLRVVVRTGDTPARERRDMTRRPPHVLVTTPESLYILLTAERSRRFLAGAETVIVDEIHALAPDKRGAHLALTLERLDALAGRPLQRIGLSATQTPIAVVGRVLCGAARPEPSIVDLGGHREMSLTVATPGPPLGPIATHEHWGAVYDRVVELVRSHRTTIVFVHTRRLAERVAHALGERLGPAQVVAHHGSMARRTRLDAEERLKCGAVPVVVATASLELGIDVGTVDLVCHIGAPRSLAAVLQRVGRSGHATGLVPKGVLFPLTRDELVCSAAAVRAVRAGELDALLLPRPPRDVLAQQIVAHVASGEQTVEEVLALARRAWLFRDLARPELETILGILADGIATRRGRRGALLHWDRVHDRLRPRRGARIAAITSGGAIPDTADYDVVEEPGGLLVGKVTEDFAIESTRGDVFLLGNRPWRILRVEAGKLLVEDAGTASPTIPFWLGEAPGRTRELSQAVSRLRQEIVTRGREHTSWLVDGCGLDARGARQLADYVADAATALGGVVPSHDTVVAERFFDEGGGMQLVLHAPFGARVNRALGLALRKRFCLTFDFELQAAATDDGIVLSLGAQHSFPLEAVFEMVRRATLEADLTQAALQSPMFGTRWRWNLARALALLRYEGGRKVPVPLLRMRAEDLLAAVFPEQLGCQDNRAGGPIPVPDHPLVRETIENCLYEAMDLDGVAQLLGDLAEGRIRRVAIETAAPSPFAHEILHSSPYTFLDDAPLEERRARAVSLRQVVPGLAGGLGALDPAAIAEVTAQAWPTIRDSDELHDLLLSLGLVPADVVQAAQWTPWSRALVEARRAVWASGGGLAATVLVATERIGLLRRAVPGARLAPDVDRGLDPRWAADASEEEALRSIVGGWLECTGPVTAGELAGRCGLPVGRVAVGLAQLERAGTALRGRFRPGAADEEWCERGLLARIHRLTLGRLRREIEPVTCAELVRFLLRWQHLAPGTRLHGRRGLLEVLGQLEGLELPARAWEDSVLPARLARYDPDDLEYLCLAGLVVWGRLRPPAGGEEPGSARHRSLARTVPLGFVLRDDLDWLLGAPPEAVRLAPAAQAVFDLLGRRGASFAAELARATGLGPALVEEALWQLVSLGLATGDGVAGLRALLGRGAGAPAGKRGRAVVPAGRWALLRGSSEEPPESPPAAVAERWARLLLRRWGVVVRGVLVRETGSPPWFELLGALRRLEARGEVRGGRFVRGVPGEQFALPEAVDTLRSIRRREAGLPEEVTVAAADPLNLVGILTDGARIPVRSLERVTWRDGQPVAASGMPMPAA